MKQLLLITCLLLCSCNEKKQDPLFLIENFFSQFENEGIDYALDQIVSANEWSMESSDVENVKLVLNEYLQYAGNYEGYELIFKRQIGKSIEQYSYLVKYERQFLRFSFIFYYASNSWRLHDFKFDTNIIDEIKESSRFYY